MLFQNRKTVKTYECLAPLAPTQRPRYGTAVRINRHLPFPLVRRSHINKDRGRLQAYESADVPNAETLIERGSGPEPSYCAPFYDRVHCHRDYSHEHYDSYCKRHGKYHPHKHGYKKHPKYGKRKYGRYHDDDYDDDEDDDD